MRRERGEGGAGLGTTAAAAGQAGPRRAVGTRGWVEGAGGRCEFRLPYGHFNRGSESREQGLGVFSHGSQQ